MRDLASLDAELLVVDWLSNHEELTGVLGGKGRIGARNAPPYPRIRITQIPGGAAAGWRWLGTFHIQVEALGDLDRSTARPALHLAFSTAVKALHELTVRPALPGQPVVTAVQALSTGGWLPEPTGQGRYLGVVALTAHPAAG
ncbi:hypothetical protein [Streptomyces sp. CB01881]|uniref:hypothetical protein n=1 Tax=Streptomyces sp. CB01881 TaxID=2078691 RepID=UPI000CDBB29E|nr:hypothetical protein [Streptomyces sp. CB01881]AUY50458.1 hypothetical protein C2142_17655 [Streptomyces sp. CB01881]TYC73845.1 hypothetical protein EH183_17635 [Streptomyces sp. CB01881]